MFSYILCRLPPLNGYYLSRWWKAAQKSHLFTGVYLWSLLHFLLEKLSVLEYTALKEDMVFLREGWDELTSKHPYMQVFHIYLKFTPRKFLHQPSPLPIFLFGCQSPPSAASPHQRMPLPYII